MIDRILFLVLKKAAPVGAPVGTLNLVIIGIFILIFFLSNLIVLRNNFLKYF